MLGNASLMVRLIAVLLLSIISCVGICISQESNEALFISLWTNAKVYRTTDEVSFRGSIKNRVKKDVTIASSIFTIEDTEGHVVFSQDRAFGISEFNPPQIKGSSGSFSSSNGPVITKKLKVGDYRAVWVVNGINSNFVSFKIQASKSRLASPALFIESLARKALSQEDVGIAGYFRNDQAEMISLFDLFSASILRLDGKPCQRMGTSWDGVTGLMPGDSWGFTLSPLEYINDITSGGHGIQFEMGGLQSNVIRILWPSK